MASSRSEGKEVITEMLLAPFFSSSRVPVYAGKGYLCPCENKTPATMNQRIKTIWLLSLVSMFLIVVTQAYWLWEQCHYKNEELMKEMHGQVMAATILNDSVRDLQPKNIFGDDRQISWSTSSANNLDFPPTNGSKPGVHYTYMHVINALTQGGVTPYYIDTIRLRSRDDLGSYLSKDIYRYMLETDVPFTLQRFDSCLHAVLPGIRFETALCRSDDTLYTNKEMVSLRGTRIAPVIEVRYPYDPFRNKQVKVSIYPGLHRQMMRMGWQLVGSMLLIGLLALCLIFQIKTILKQRRIDELRKDFVNTMIHELRRPVQTLKMCTALLGSKSLSADRETRDEALRDSASELDNLSAYLQKLRDMTRADDEQLHLSITTFDLSLLAEKLIRLQHRPEGKEVTFEVRMARPLQATADETHLANVLNNLLENAVKYSPERVHIILSASSGEGWLRVEVTDNGYGIPVGEQAHVFDKFYRGDNASKLTQPGIGLGLSYVKLLVEAHHGHVSLHSRPGQGTTIGIAIPQGGKATRQQAH